MYKGLQNIKQDKTLRTLYLLDVKGCVGMSRLGMMAHVTGVMMETQLGLEGLTVTKNHMGAVDRGTACRVVRGTVAWMRSTGMIVASRMWSIAPMIGITVVRTLVKGSGMGWVGERLRPPSVLLIVAPVGLDQGLMKMATQHASTGVYVHNQRSQPEPSGCGRRAGCTSRTSGAEAALTVGRRMTYRLKVREAMKVRAWRAATSGFQLVAMSAVQFEGAMRRLGAHRAVRAALAEARCQRRGEALQLEGRAQCLGNAWRRVLTRWRRPAPGAELESSGEKRLSESKQRAEGSRGTSQTLRRRPQNVQRLRPIMRSGPRPCQRRIAWLLFDAALRDELRATVILRYAMRQPQQRATLRPE